ncbi:MAG: sulfate adenylyltransferase [bacterium]|nr:sulfate adenylyltransferase [bacterium]
MIEPHGGKLVNRIAKDSSEWNVEISSLQKIVLTDREISDLEMISIGGFSPLEGFMGSADYASVLKYNRLANGIVWTIPVTLAVTAEEANPVTEEEKMALLNQQNQILGILHLTEKYTYDKKQEAKLVYGTEDAAHPGVKAVYEQGEILLGGKITLIHRPEHLEFSQYWLPPEQTRRLFQEKGWNRVVGFQTRNPVHRAHEYIQKCALEIVDGLLLHPIVGKTKKDDIPAEVRMKCYEVLLAKYYPKDRVVLAVNPSAMRYAGPREAIFHAIVRKNYGCTHFIVGRDHAGVGNYYGSYDAQYIFDEFTQEELGIIPLFFEHAFYCRRCGEMASPKTCPHDKADHFSLSGTKVRELLQAGEIPPPEFTRPEIANILIDWYRETRCS